jgi:hypothetical protein
VSLPDAGSPREIHIDGNPQLELEPLQAVELRAVVLSSGLPVEGAPVRFALSGPPAGTVLRSALALTDAWGRASATLTAGEVGSFWVSAATEGALPVEWAVSVSRPTRGSLAVTLSYAGAQPPSLGAGRARAYAEAIRCADLAPRTTRPSPLAEGAVSAPGAAVTLESLTAGRYTVAGSFDDPDRPVVVVWGCAEGVEVVAAETRDLALPVGWVSPVVRGIYDAAAHYDFAEALPGPISELTRALVGAFDDRDEQGNPLFAPANDPGYFLADLLLRTVFGASDPFSAAFLATLLNLRVLTPVPWRSQMASIGTALTEALSHFEVRSELSFAEGDGGLAAHEAWKTLVIHFRGHDHVFSLQDRGPGTAGAALPAALDMAVSADGGAVGFASHRATLSYGALALFVLERVVLEEIAGVTSLRAALAALVDCRRFARELAGIGLPVTAPLCEALLDAADRELRSAFERSAAGRSTLNREGGAHAVDADLDPGVIAETLKDGTWSGTLQVHGEPRPFSGVWTAKLREE